METDKYWDAIVGNGGQESACGWCKDKWGVSWQITPKVLRRTRCSRPVHVTTGWLACGKLSGTAEKLMT
jgi:predicted 3-demethylubiquinone-9 3-methyltransferase (glyoxalase superfamily)